MSDCVEAYLGEFCMIRDPDPGAAGDLLIVFSAADTPPGKFLWSKVLKKDRRKQIYLNCPANGWYLHGIPGLGETPGAVADALSKLAAERFRGVGRVCATGGSMGGYAAIAVGSLIGADAILAFGAELTLGIGGSNSARHVSDDGGFLLRELERSKNSITLVYGENFFADLIGVLNAKALLDEKSVKVITMRDRPHSIPPYLEHRYGLVNIMNSLFAGRELPIEKNEIGSIVDYPWLIRIGYACQEFMRTGKMAGAVGGHLEVLYAQGTDDMPGRYAAYGLAFRALLNQIEGNVQAALDDLARAARENPNNLLIMSVVGRVALNCGAFELASQYARRAIDLQEPQFFNLDLESYLVAAQSAAKLGRRQEAREVLNECLALRPNFKKASALLAKL